MNRNISKSPFCLLLIFFFVFVFVSGTPHFEISICSQVLDEFHKYFFIYLYIKKIFFDITEEGAVTTLGHSFLNNSIIVLTS